MSLSRYVTASAAAGLLAVTAAAPALAAGASGTGAAAAPPAVERVDVARYLGDWYQVAAIPQLFELQCAKNAKAAYTLTAAGTVGVRNTCATWLGSTSTVTGEATPLDASAARLNVSFLKLGGSYVHTGDANYIVTGLDPEYRWAVVTDSGRKSGFVLSRTPALTTGQQAAVRAVIGAAGLDACDFRVTRQDGGAQTGGRLC
ncbi:lipocalin family protein [Streptomyces sp. NPDC003717]|uniref:lipocalin family protein n=1 Tax=Streptomyces sp. NPDC003717 TaxID=3154276 RepID=UPI00339F0DD9